MNFTHIKQPLRNTFVCDSLNRWRVKHWLPIHIIIELTKSSVNTLVQSGRTAALTHGKAQSSPCNRLYQSDRESSGLYQKRKKIGTNLRDWKPCKCKNKVAVLFTLPVASFTLKHQILRATNSYWCKPNAAECIVLNGISNNDTHMYCVQCVKILLTH